MNPFVDRMASLSNEQLIRIMVERKDYVPEALRAAERELARRQVELSVVNQAIAEGERLRELENSRSDIPLTDKERWAYFFLSFITFTPMVAFFYRYHAEKGYSLKSNQSMGQVALGLLFYIALWGIMDKFIF